MTEDIRAYGPLRRYLKKHVKVWNGYPVHNFVIDPRDDRIVSVCFTYRGRPRKMFYGYYENVVAEVERGIHERIL